MHIRNVVVLAAGGLLWAGVVLGPWEAQRRQLRFWLAEAERAEAARQPRQAAAAYAHVFALDSSHVEASLQHVPRLVQARHYQRAFAALDRVLANGSTADHFERAGKALWELIVQEMMVRQAPHNGADSIYAAQPVAAQERDRWFDRLLFAYREALRLDPTRTHLYRELTQHCTTVKRFDEALEIYREAQRVLPDEAWVWSDYGDLLQRHKGRTKEGLAYQDIAIAQDRTDWRRWASKAAALGEAGRYDEAVAAWDQAIALNQDDPSTRSWHRFLKAQDLYVAGRDTAAEAALRRALRADRRNELAWYYLADLLRRLNRPPAEQLQTLDSGLVSMRWHTPLPLYWEMWLLRGTVLQELGRAEEADAAFDTVLVYQPGHAEAYRRKAQIRLAGKQLVDALALIEAALQQDGKDAAAWQVKAEILTQFGKAEEAGMAAERAQEAQARAKGEREFVEEYRRTRDIIDSTLATVDHPTRADSNRAWRASSIASFERSREKYRQSGAPDDFLIKEPDSYAAWMINAQSLEMAGRLAEAEIACTKALEFKPDKASVYHLRSAVRAQLEKREEALADLEHAIALDARFAGHHNMDARFRNLWGDPRFERLTKPR